MCLHSLLRKKAVTIPSPGESRGFFAFALLYLVMDATSFLQKSMSETAKILFRNLNHLCEEYRSSISKGIFDRESRLYIPRAAIKILIDDGLLCNSYNRRTSKDFISEGVDTIFGYPIFYTIEDCFIIGHVDAIIWSPGARPALKMSNPFNSTGNIVTRL